MLYRTTAAFNRFDANQVVDSADHDRADIKRWVDQGYLVKDEDVADGVPVRETPVES